MFHFKSKVFLTIHRCNQNERLSKEEFLWNNYVTKTCRNASVSSTFTKAKNYASFPNIVLTLSLSLFLLKYSTWRGVQMN